MTGTTFPPSHVEGFGSWRGLTLRAKLAHTLGVDFDTTSEEAMVAEVHRIRAGQEPVTDADLSAALDIAWRLCGDFYGERDEWPRLQRSGAFVEQHAPKGGGTWAIYEVDPEEVLLWDPDAEWEHPRERIGKALVEAPELIRRLVGEMRRLHSSQVGVCPCCGIGVRLVDEDGGCITCGEDLIIAADQHSAELVWEMARRERALCAGTTAPGSLLAEEGR